MSVQLPGDVLSFLAELEEATNLLIEKYYNLSDGVQEAGTNRQFKYFAPISVRVFTGDQELARFYEEGIDLYPEAGK